MLKKLKTWLPWLFYDPKPCGVCHQTKLGVEKRKFLMPPQMKEEMTSVSEMCNECYENLTKLVYNIGNERS